VKKFSTIIGIQDVEDVKESSIDFEDDAKCRESFFRLLQDIRNDVLTIRNAIVFFVFLVVIGIIVGIISSTL